MESTTTLVRVSEAERLILERWVAAHSTPQSVAMRARIVLLAAAGESNSEIARRLAVSRPTVSLWKERVSAGGAAYPAHDVTHEEGLIRLADEALYRAKRSGRNRVEIAGGEIRTGGSHSHAP